MREPRLAIQKGSWHYRYFIYIRNFWGLTEEPERTSLCPYCQTMIWFSLAVLLLSPVLVLGWLLLKIGRTAYKGLDAMGCNRIIDFLDDKTPVSEILDIGHRKVEVSPGLGLLVTVLLTAISLAIIGALISLVCLAAFEIIMHVMDIPAALVTLFWGAAGLLHRLGWCLFVAAGFIGYLLQQATHWTWFGIHWFFTNGPMWLGIWWWTRLVLIFSAASLVTGLVVNYLLSTKVGQAVSSKIWFKLNGYGEARERARVRRKAAAAAAHPEGPRLPCFFSRCLCGFGRWVKAQFSRDLKIGNKVSTVLGPIGIFFGFLWALKKQACPIVDFVEPPAPQPPKCEDGSCCCSNEPKE